MLLVVYVFEVNESPSAASPVVLQVSEFEDWKIITPKWTDYSSEDSISSVP